MSTLKKSRGEGLTEGPLLSKIIYFALPLVLTGVLQLLFNTADSMVVGRWGGDTPEESAVALAAVGSCGALINLIVNIFMGLSVGAGVCVAHDVGAKDYEGVSRTVHTAVVASLFCGVAVTAVGLLCAPELLLLMKTDPEVLDQAVPYIRAYFCGMPASIVYNYCAAMLRSSGDTARPLAFLSIGGVVNVVLNLILVLVFRQGALGVGVATATSQWVSCILIIIFMIRSDGPCKIIPSKLSVNGAKLKKILLIGLPAGLQGTLFSLSNVIIQSSINGFDDVSVVAGNTAAANLDAYIYMTENALYQTAITFVGQHVGAGNKERLKKCILLCICSSVVAGLVVSSLVYLFGRPLLAIFAPGNEAVIEVGMKRLLIVGMPYFLCGLMEVGSGIMRGYGKSLQPMIVSLIGSCALRILWIYTVFAANPTIEMLYISYPITWIITASAHFVCVFFTIRRKRGPSPS